MSAKADRQRLVVQARLLAGAGASGGGPRAARLARRLKGRPEAALAFADIDAVPDWAAWPDARRRALGDFAAAAACTEALRRTIDGRRLARVARRIGDPALDAILATPPGLVSPIADAETALASDESFAALGAAVLLAEVAGRPAAAARLAELFPAVPPAIDAEAGRRAAHAARGLFMAFEAGALEAAA